MRGSVSRARFGRQRCPLFRRGFCFVLVTSHSSLVTALAVCHAAVWSSAVLPLRHWVLPFSRHSSLLLELVARTFALGVRGSSLANSRILIARLQGRAADRKVGGLRYGCSSLIHPIIGPGCDCIALSEERGRPGIHRRGAGTSRLRGRWQNLSGSPRQRGSGHPGVDRNRQRTRPPRPLPQRPPGVCLTCLFTFHNSSSCLLTL